MQRTSLKISVGMGGKQGEAARAPTPIVEQARAAEVMRLARVRYCFELVQRIENCARDGGTTGALRRELDEVRSGRVDPPLAAFRGPSRPRNPKVVQTDRKTRTATTTKVSTDSEKGKNLRSRGLLQMDITDLRKAKVTLDGVALVKTLLTNFDELLIAELLGVSIKTVKKIAGSTLVQMAPFLRPQDIVAVVQILEERIRED